MLRKEPNKRITLKELLQHPWLTMNCKDMRVMRENATTENEFRLNTLAQPLKGGLKC